MLGKNRDSPYFGRDVASLADNTLTIALPARSIVVLEVT